jgi:hypothetical protein
VARWHSVHVTQTGWWSGWLAREQTGHSEGCNGCADGGCEHRDPDRRDPLPLRKTACWPGAIEAHRDPPTLSDAVPEFPGHATSCQHLCTNVRAEAIRDAIFVPVAPLDRPQAGDRRDRNTTVTLDAAVTLQGAPTLRRRRSPTITRNAAINLERIPGRGIVMLTEMARRGL